MLEKCPKLIIYQKIVADKIATADQVNNCLLLEYISSKIVFPFELASLDSPDFRLQEFFVLSCFLFD